MQMAQQAQRLEQYRTDGYLIARGVLSPEIVERVRGYVERAVARAGEGGGGPGLDEELAARQGELDEAERQERFRKISQLGMHDADHWNDFHVNPNVLAIMRTLLGDDIRLMFSATFLKPARHGGATPWHQDLALWKWKVPEAVNIWCAIDAATKENGCLQFIPGSYRNGEVEHVHYEGGLHQEIRRDLMDGLEPVHVELEPGDAVVWTSAMFHYSPPNLSDKSRIGVAGVYCSQQQVDMAGPTQLALPWVMKAGDVHRH